MSDGLRTRFSATALAVGALALLASLGAAMPVGGAELSRGVQQSIRAATFEVVQLKPPDGEISYDHPPPMDLIPYQQRTDKYRSIGTAFAIGSNRYVTAAHVILAGQDSLFGPPALRDSAGKVYDIDQVFKFSDRRDFVVFSLREPPKGVKVLTPGDKPALNATVYAVGNALGEGVVFRDGLYTSDTPEELDGQWRWLRFSAAASPGNSGGPLVDEHGKVIGVVLRKSPAENLNMALPIAELLNAKDNEGVFGGRIPVRLPIFDASETVSVNERFDLPQPLAQFYTTMQERALRFVSGAEHKLLEDNADHLFPRGAGSERLLNTIDRGGFPRLMHEDPNKVWVTQAPQLQTVQLDHNGFVELSGNFVRLRSPDDVSLAALYSDDKLYLDLLLKAYTLRRTVGTDSVRVTSLGKPRNVSHFTDRWGRTWQIRDWAIPYDDQFLSVVSLPVPGGYIASLNKINSRFLEVVHKGQQLLSDYIYVTMLGNLAQWQDYLAQQGVQPTAFEHLKLKIDPEREVLFQSDRYEVTVRPELIKLSKDSMLYLDFGFSAEGDGATWGVKRVVVSEGPHTNNWVDVFWRSEPPASLPDGFQSNWNKLKTQSFPYNGRIESQNGQTSISAAVQPPRVERVRYGLGVTREGVETQEAMGRKLELLRHSFVAVGD